MCSSFRSTKLAPILSLSLVLSKYLILPNFFPLPPPLSFSFFFSLSLYTARQYRSEMGKTCSSTSLYLTSQVLLTLLSQLKLLFYFVFVLVSFWFFFFQNRNCSNTKPPHRPTSLPNTNALQAGMGKE